MSGIYLIRNTLNGKVYVGQSVHVRIRWRQHRRCARQGHKSHLYDAIRKYGEDVFVHELLEACAPEQFDGREAYWMDQYDCRNPEKGYNLMPAGQCGRVMDAATRERLSLKMRGRKRDPEVVRRVAEKIRARKRGDETKAAAERTGKKSRAELAAASKARWLSLTADERKAYAAQRRGYTHTDDARAKMSMHGKGRPKSDATRARIREAQLNAAPEVKARRLAALREANKRRWDKWRAEKAAQGGLSCT